MENINIGIVNLILSNQIRESYFNSDVLNESKSLLNEFINVVKASPILQLEFKVFDNIENKHIENELIATRYIDNNIKLFEVYTLKEILNERKKLNKFINESEIPNDNSKVRLYQAIDELIRESISDYDKIDVDKIHESFTYVLNHIKKTKNQNIINEAELVNEEILEIAVNKFNDKYNSLDENDKNLLKTLVKSTDDEKYQLLESYKNEVLEVLEKLKNENVQEGIEKAITKINEMNYNTKSKEFSDKIIDDIIGLHELKREII